MHDRAEQIIEDVLAARLDGLPASATDELAGLLSGVREPPGDLTGRGASGRPAWLGSAAAVTAPPDAPAGGGDLLGVTTVTPQPLQPGAWK